MKRFQLTKISLRDAGIYSDGGVCGYLLVVANVQHNDTGLYLCTDHGEPPSHPLRSVRLTVTGLLYYRCQHSRNNHS